MNVTHTIDIYSKELVNAGQSWTLSMVHPYKILEKNIQLLLFNNCNWEITTIASGTCMYN